MVLGWTCHHGSNCQRIGVPNAEFRVGAPSPASNLSLRERTYHFLNSTKSASGAARAFNLFIITLILLNITAMILESVKEIRTFMPRFFWWFECFSVAVFSVEYVLRVWSCVEEPKYRRPVLGRLRFALTPLALVDLSAVLPFYLRFIPADLRIMRMFRMIRIMRVMRIARVAKLGRYSESFQMLLRVVQSRREPLLSSLLILLILAVVSATLMFYAENKAQPKAFSSIPASMWWAVATLDHNRLRRCLPGHRHRQAHGVGHRRAGHRHVRPADGHSRVRLHGGVGEEQKAAEVPALRKGTMRPIGRLQDESQARRFGDFLYAQGIENQVDPDLHGTWEIWVLDDANVEPAKQMLDEFTQHPDDPRFAEASRTAVQKRKEQQQQQAQTGQRVRLIDGRTIFYSPPVPIGILTLILVVISVAVTLLADFGKKYQLVQPFSIAEPPRLYLTGRRGCRRSVTARSGGCSRPCSCTSVFSTSSSTCSGCATWAA